MIQSRTLTLLHNNAGILNVICVSELVLGMIEISTGAGGYAVFHINRPERRARARKLFSSRSKQNIPLRGEISSNIWLHYRPLSSLHSLQKLIRQREQMRGKSKAERWGPKMLQIFYFFWLVIHDPHFLKICSDISPRPKTSSEATEDRKVNEE